MHLHISRPTYVFLSLCVFLKYQIKFPFYHYTDTSQTDDIWTLPDNWEVYVTTARSVSVIYKISNFTTENSFNFSAVSSPFVFYFNILT
jgi:hypothetical protein